jgi:hypothetical protein
MDTTLPSHFLKAVEKFGLTHTWVVGTRRSRIDLHRDDFLLEAEKEERGQRAWGYIDQRPQDMSWFDQQSDGTWPNQVDERLLG